MEIDAANDDGGGYGLICLDVCFFSLCVCNGCVCLPAAVAGFLSLAFAWNDVLYV